MSRPMLPSSLLAFVCALAALAQASAEAADLPLARSATEVQKRLQQPVTAEGFEPNTPLREALGFVAEHFGLTILVDAAAFRDDLSINEPEQQPVKLPKLVQVPLRFILLQLANQGQGTFVQEGTVLWLVPPQRARERALRQRVGVEFDKQPLRKALVDVADQTGFTVVLDQHRAGISAESKISGNFQGVGLEETVRTLADMAGLKAILVGDIYYVTTEEHANELAQDEKQRQREQKEQQKALEDDKAKKKGEA